MLLMHLLLSALVDMVVAEDQHQQIMLAVVVAAQVIVMALAVNLRDLPELVVAVVAGVRPLLLSVLVVQVL